MIVQKNHEGTVSTCDEAYRTFVRVASSVILQIKLGLNEKVEEFAINSMMVFMEKVWSMFVSCITYDSKGS